MIDKVALELNTYMTMAVIEAEKGRHVESEALIRRAQDCVAQIVALRIKEQENEQYDARGRI